jgi:uncharacterized protein YbaP (TraB family)
MSIKNVLFWLIPALSWSAGCGSTAKVNYTPEQLVPSQKAILWKISGNGLKKPSFLLGTIHMIPKESFTVSTQTQAALDQVKRVAFEIDMKEMTNFRTQLSLMTKAFMAGGKTLKDLLPPEDYAFVKAKLSDKGLPNNMLERLKPLFLSTMFSGDESGAASDAGPVTSVEMEVYKLAKKRKLESTGLETAGYQMAIFDSIPYEAQAKMLLESLRAPEETQEGKSELEKMVDLYLAQDITAMQALIADDESGMGNFDDILLNNRNQNWIPKMGQLMREKPTMFAVGAGHLGGAKGVVALLRKAGYRVEPN